MLSFEEARLQNEEKLVKLMRELRDNEVNLSDCKNDLRKLRQNETEFENNIARIKKEARAITIQLFGEEPEVCVTLNE